MLQQKTFKEKASRAWSGSTVRKAAQARGAFNSAGNRGTTRNDEVSAPEQKESPRLTVLMSPRVRGSDYLRVASSFSCCDEGWGNHHHQGIKATALMPHYRLRLTLIGWLVY